MKELKKLIDQIEREKKIRKILLFSLGLSISASTHLLTRGGSTDFLPIIDTDYIKTMCDIDEGVGYLDDKRLRNIITDLYRHKNKGKIIYVTATALCHIANQYGQTFLALPFAIGDFGLTNLYQTLQKVLATILLGAVPPLYVIGSPVSLTFAFILGVSGFRLTFNINNLNFIPTSPVDAEKGVQQRILGIVEVVIVNNRDKIIMHDPVKENPECWLPDQRLLNSNCNKIKLTEIPDAIDSFLPGYEDTVNMQDVTGLDRVQFTDELDLGQTKPSNWKPPRQGKQVNFLDKFEDSGQISESEQWDTCDNEFMVPEKKNLRTRN